MHRMEARIPLLALGKAAVWAGALGFLFCGSPLLAQDFPKGVEGVLYYCPRIDLIPQAEGGPLKIELNGTLDEPAWERAEFQKWSNTAGAREREFEPHEEDLDMSWAAVADKDYLYVAWRVVDEQRQSSETFFCTIWQDDSVEIYLDTLNDGPECPGGASCYGTDDAQISIGADQVGKHDPLNPDLLEFGGVAGKGSCDFNQAAPELCRGVVAELDSEAGVAGDQGEVAIALDTLGNLDGEGNPDGTPEWHIEPLHGVTIGWNFHVNDDDDAGERDHKLLWSKVETAETAWQNPAAFGKLQFVAPNTPLVAITRDIPNDLENGGSGTVTFTVSPKFGVGTVVINEKLPPTLVPSQPSSGGTIAENTVTWNLGQVDTEVVVSYTMTADPQAADVALPGTATVNGQQVQILGDAFYTGSPFSVDGFIKLWNHLGPLAPGGCDPGPDLELDWIVNDGATVTEENIRPFLGMITRPKYGGDGVVPGGSGARATGLKVREGSLVADVQDQYPVWKGSVSPTDTVDHSSVGVHGFDADDHLTMSCVYVTNTTTKEISTQIGLGSDDSIQVLLNDESVAFHACRGWGQRNQEQDVALAVLPPGESRLLVKVSDGTGASGFRLRFQNPADPTGPGLMPPTITASLESKTQPPPGKVVRDFSKPSFALGETIDVSLAATAATGTPDMKIREILPPGSTASAISDRGAQTGDVIEWDLPQLTQKTVTYTLKPASCLGTVSFGQSSFKVGVVEGLVTGKSSLPRLTSDEALGEWDSRDVGYTGGAAQRLSDHDVFANALGEGIKLFKDEFRFISIQRNGDFEFSARIGCFDDPAGKGLAGLMVRDSLEAGAANAFFGMNSVPPAAGGVGTLRVSFRQDLNKPTSQVTGITAKDVTALPIYLRIVRTGSKLSFQRSEDGSTYREVAAKNTPSDQRPISLKEAALVGLALTGVAGSTRATFEAVSGPPFTAVDVAGFRRGDTDGSGRLDLTDAIAVLGRLFLGAAEPECLDAAAADDSGVLDLTDAIYSLGFQFTGSAVPPAPGPTACGPDPSDDGFKACVYVGCN